MLDQGRVGSIIPIRKRHVRRERFVIPRQIHVIVQRGSRYAEQPAVPEHVVMAHVAVVKNIVIRHVRSIIRQAVNA